MTEALDSGLDEIARTAERLLDAQFRNRALEERDGGDAGELVEGTDVITFILLAKGLREYQIRVRVRQRSIEVDTPGFFLKRTIPAVAPLTATSKYLNGVVSISAHREQEFGWGPSPGQGSSLSTSRRYRLLEILH